jgi:hypothetical protein
MSLNTENVESKIVDWNVDVESFSNFKRWKSMDKMAFHRELADKVKFQVSTTYEVAEMMYFAHKFKTWKIFDDCNSTRQYVRDILRMSVTWWHETLQIYSKYKDNRELFEKIGGKNLLKAEKTKTPQKTLDAMEKEVDKNGFNQDKLDKIAPTKDQKHKPDSKKVAKAKEEVDRVKAKAKEEADRVKAKAKEKVERANQQKERQVQLAKKKAEAERKKKEKTRLQAAKAKERAKKTRVAASKQKVDLKKAYDNLERLYDAEKLANIELTDQFKELIERHNKLIKANKAKDKLIKSLRMQLKECKEGK